LKTRFPGWHQVILLTVTEPVSWGILYYTFSVMLPLMERDLGWSPALVSGAFSLALLVSGFAAVVAGRWLDERGPHILMTAGSVAAVVLVLAWSQVQTPLGLYAIWLFIGLVMAMVLYEPAFWVITAWFTQARIHERGRALTVLTFGGGLASTIFIPLSNALSLAYGWRNALFILAGVLAVFTIAPHALGLRQQPPHLRERLGKTSTPTELQTDIQKRGLLRQPAFWLLSLAFSLSALAWSGMSIHLISYELSRGMDATVVAWAAGFIGITQVVGRVLLTPISDRISGKTIAVVLFVIQAAAFLALLALPMTLGLIIYVICFGIGFGVLTPIRAALIADIFGARQFGSVNGAISLSSNLARAAAPLCVGLFIGIGGYEPVLWVAVAVCLAAGVTVARVGGSKEVVSSQ